MKKFNHLSLKALYSFSLAARYLNYSHTADVLAVTPSAVSHQIKKLEDDLGCKLFDRNGAGFTLTSAGRVYAAEIQQAFDQMRTATDRLTGFNDHVIHVGVETAFAVKRLTPKLQDWQALYPDLDVRLRMLSCGDPLAGLDLDVMIGIEKLGSEAAHYDVTSLAQEKYFPVCSRDFYRQMSSPLSVDTLLQFPLIDIEGVDSWHLWAQAMTDGDHSAAKCHVSHYFSHTLLMIEAVLAGQGIALIEASLIKSELARGDLMCLSDQPFCPTTAGYFFAVHKKRRGDTNIKAMQKWIKSLLLTGGP